MTPNTSRASVADRITGETEWQRAWFSLQRREWSSLAIIGTESGAEAEMAARHLAMIGTRDGHKSVRVLSALNLTFADAPRAMDYLAEAGTNGELVVVACDPVQHNQATLALLQAVSGVILVVRLGMSRTACVKKTIEIVGRDRLVATISVG